MTRPLRSRSAINRKSLRVHGVAPGSSSHGVDRDGDAVVTRSQSLPVESARQAQREMDRLRRLSTSAPEAAQVRGYLQWLWSLPWETSAPEDADLRRVESVLQREHLGLSKAKER